MSRGGGTRRPRGEMRWLLALVAAMAATAAGQPATRGTGTGRALPLLGADEDTLWLVQVGPERSQIHRRGKNEAFKAGEPLNAPLARVVAAAGALYALTDDGQLYVLAGGSWSRGRDLPDRVPPLDWAGGPDGLFALVRSPAAGRLSRYEAESLPADTQPFEPGDARFSVVRYDRGEWVGVVPCPAAVAATALPRLAPRLLRVHEPAGETLYVFWHSAAEHGIQFAARAAASEHWVVGEVAAELPDLAGFWVTTVSRLPTVVVATHAPDGTEALCAFRLLGGRETDATAWRPGRLEFSRLPGGAKPARYQAAVGFNQHVAALVADERGTAYLQFGRIEATPAEPTLAVKTVFDGQGRFGPSPQWVQTGTVVVLFAVLAALFLRRRGAMVQVIELPAGWAPAFTFQRLAGFAIDLAPFALVAGAVTGVNWQAALRELFGWAAGGDAVHGRLPALPTLTWWGFTIASHTVYSLVMELLTRRTVGKLATGTRLLSDAVAPPTSGQILLRNLCRFVELLPPLWVLGFLVVLSRNRQRVGDIFARTIVVRRTGINHRDTAGTGKSDPG